MHRSALSILVLLALGIVSGGPGRAGEIPSPDRQRHTEYLVGVYYFSGWWREPPNKYFTAGRDWRPDWPGRRALLGEYNEQETMDREIAAAADSGVSFFQILWYGPCEGADATAQRQKLNQGLRLFMASTNSSRMKFTVELVNHPPFQFDTDSAWESACREWCAAMKHPSYLRVAGRPVFKVHGADFFYNQNGRDPVRVAKRLGTFRHIAHASGLPDLLISGGVGAGGVASGPVVAPYDFLTTYMEMPSLPQHDKPYPYETLLAYAEQGWQRYARLSEKPYVPYLPAGWDPRPWKDPRASFDFPDRAQGIGALQRVKTALDSSPALGIRLPSGERQKMLLIYAWNEFGEGGIVAPTQGDGDMKLRAIASVFGGGSSRR
jgi:hypothetical protein